MDTIYALSSGALPAGVAVVRVSGPGVRFAIETITGPVPEARVATVATLRDPQGQRLLDRGIVLYFKAPNSFTGEDCGEFQLHGGQAIVASVLDVLGSFDGFRIAEPGEFSRRAFVNGKFDLTELEGLADLINAKTRTQHDMAISHASGMLSVLYDGWCRELIRIRAFMEAGFDFSEEEDVEENQSRQYLNNIAALQSKIVAHLESSRKGEMISDGFNVVLLGPPNSGKSSLLNALAKREVAIVTAIAGTTRDVIEIQLELAGYLVNVYDTAGIRQTEDIIESIGIDRAVSRAKTADLAFWLSPFDDPNGSSILEDQIEIADLVQVRSKSDLCEGVRIDDSELAVSVHKDTELDHMIDVIVGRIKDRGGIDEGTIVSRHRHKVALQRTVDLMSEILDGSVQDEELVAEQLRLAAFELGRITGQVDVEDLLDVIFGEFCIGK